MQTGSTATSSPLFHSAEPLFRPRTIAFVGASDSGASWAKAIFENIRAVQADVACYPINPKRESVWGQRCYPSFGDLPVAVDLALVVTPAATVAASLREGLAHGLRAATIYAAGFGEGHDPAGVVRAAELSQLAAAGLRICGPNCMGTLSLAERLYLYPTARVRDVQPGSVGVVMQSGGVLQYWTQNAAARGIGVSYAVSSGNEVDLDAADYINFLVEDERTTLICALIEGVRRPQAFMAAAARAAAARKPIVLMKIGRSAGAQAAAATHTGALAADDRVFDAVCERYAIVRVPSLDDLIETALAFRSGRLPAASGTVFVGYSGSARGMLLDAADAAGLELAQITPATREALAPHIDDTSVLENPIDLGATISRDHERFARIAEIVAGDPNVGVLAVQAQLPLAGERADPQWLAGVMARTTKPVFAYARTQQNVVAEGSAFQAATGMSFLQGIPRSVGAARDLVAYARRVERAADASLPVVPERDGDPVALAGIARPASAFAASAEEAVARALEIGFPVALKLHSPKPIHKTEVGGVALGLRHRDAVATAAQTLFATAAQQPELGCDGVLVQEMVAGLELIAGVRSDPQYGPIVMLGLGGVLVEALDDLALRLLPIDAAGVREMLAGLRGRRLLGEFRGRAARDVDAVVAAVVALGDAFLACRASVDEVEINPLIVLERGRGVRAVDVRIVRSDER